MIGTILVAFAIVPDNMPLGIGIGAGTGIIAAFLLHRHKSTNSN